MNYLFGAKVTFRIKVLSLKFKSQINQNDIIVRVGVFVFVEKLLEIVEFGITISVLVKFLENLEDFLLGEDLTVRVKCFH